MLAISWQTGKRKRRNNREAPGGELPERITMDIYKFMRELGEDTPEQDLVTDDMLDELDMDETDFMF